MKFSRFITYIILALAVMAGGYAPGAEAAKKKAKAKTVQVSKSKSKSKSKKKSKSKSKKRKRVRSSSSRTKTKRSSVNASTRRAGTRTSAEASPVPADVRRTVASSQTKKDNKRKIKVVKPDLDEIRRITLDPSSQYYFPKLKKKYETNDTTMTPEEFRNFYLGYMFQEDFDPYRVSPYSNITDELRNKPTHTREEIDTITKYALLSLEDNPFDLRQMSFLIHVLKERRKDMRAKIWEYRLENLLGAIKSTGTGDKVEDAWYVMYPVHEYDMVQLLGYEAVDAQFIEPGYDYLEVQPDEGDTRKRDKSAKGFYFNVIVPQQQYELKHPEEISDILPPEGVILESDTESESDSESEADDIPAE